LRKDDHDFILSDFVMGKKLLMKRVGVKILKSTSNNVRVSAKILKCISSKVRVRGKIFKFTANKVRVRVNIFQMWNSFKFEYWNNKI
jgi:hypothetical protein